MLTVMPFKCHSWKLMTFCAGAGNPHTCPNGQFRLRNGAHGGAHACPVLLQLRARVHDALGCSAVVRLQ